MLPKSWSILRHVNRSQASTGSYTLGALYNALEAEARAHQHLVNIGEELKTVYVAGQQPDDDEMLRLHEAYDALLEAARNMYAAVYDEQVIATRKRAA
jgi:hypothetical protein